MGTKMTTKNKILLALAALAAAFALGRYTAPVKIQEVTKTDEKQTEKKNIETDKHKETTVVEEVKPDGTKVTTTKTVEDATKHLQDDKSKDKSTESEKVVTKETSKLNISALAGSKISTQPELIYGGSISRNLIGPVTTGLWGLSNGTAGVSIGLTF